jgi:hypothetical protein
MMMFRLTELAKQDLRSIGRYTQVTWGRNREIFTSTGGNASAIAVPSLAAG